MPPKAQNPSVIMAGCLVAHKTLLYFAIGGGSWQSLLMTQHIIFGNYGNETVGLMRWAYEQKLAEVYVVSVDTGWQAKDWQARVLQGEDLAREYGFTPIRLQPKLSFAKLVEQQGNFPSTQYQWCAGFLKALPFIDWLDEIDPQGQALLMLANRRTLAQGQAALEEYIEESEHFGERRIWHPLFQHGQAELKALVAQTSLDYLSHRSLECDPCVNNVPTDFKRLARADINKTSKLEGAMKQPMFSPLAYGDGNNIEQVIQWLEKNPQSDTLTPIDMGCGSPFACGL